MCFAVLQEMSVPRFQIPLAFKDGCKAALPVRARTVTITATITITCHGYDLDGDCLKSPAATFVSTSANLDLAVENALYEAAQTGWQGIPSMARKAWRTAQYLCPECVSVTPYRAIAHGC